MSFDDIGGNATRWLYILINGFNDIDDDDMSRRHKNTVMVT